VRVVAGVAYISGVVSIVQLALLGLFYAQGAPFGTLNDVAVVVQYVLALPLILALHKLLHRSAPTASAIALWLGLGGILAIVVLQALLIAGVLSFAQQVGPVSAALFLLFGGSLLTFGYLGRSLKVLPNSMLMSILGWTYFGYPIWAFWLGSRLGKLESHATSGD
jgi:hypothetical protein